MAYIDDIFVSYKGACDSDESLRQWLDGDRGWREPLRSIGQLASHISDLATRDLVGAKSEWYAAVGAGQLWIRRYIGSVPLLYATALRVDNDDEAFVQFMNNLATLAEL